MSTSAYVIAGILPYVAVPVFVAGVAYRFLGWIRSPQPAPMTLYPTRGAGWRSLAREVLFFPSLYRGDRALWGLAWPLHVTLALVLAGHLRAIAPGVDGIATRLGIGEATLASWSTVLGGTAGIVLGALAVALLVRRGAVRRVREVSTLPDVVAILLLVAVIATGDCLRFGHADLHATRAWSASLLHLAPVLPEQPALLLHLLSVELFLLYVAFSKLMHGGGSVFTFALIKRSAP